MLDRKLQDITDKIDHYPYYMAIDGRCAAGKTTLAQQLQREIGCTVIHMDDFYLQPHQRTRERMLIPGENVDYERFLQEVMLPLKQGTDAIYRPYDCHRKDFLDTICVSPMGVIVIEGSYCCHKALWEYYDLHVFLDVEESVQKERIKIRNGAMAEQFFTKWIPMEEAYITAFSLRERCELVL